MTISCRDLREMAEAYLTGEIPAEMREQVQEHLAGCPACRAEVDGIRVLRASLQRAFLATPELAASTDLSEAIRRQLKPVAPVPRRVAAWRYRWLATAAAVVVVSATALATAMGVDASRLVALARGAWGDHRNCAVAFHLSERPISLEEASWIFDPAFARLQTTPDTWIPIDGRYALVTERHSCVFEGRRYAHIVLKFRGELVSLLIAPEEPSRMETVIRAVTMTAQRVRVLNVDGAPATVFRVSEHLAFVVGNLPEEDLRRLTEALAGPVRLALAG